MKRVTIIEKQRQTKARNTRESDDLDEIAHHLNQIINQSTATEERLAKLEKLRTLEDKREKTEQSRRKPSFGPITESAPRFRPPSTEFHISKHRGYPKSKDVTLQQIFESLQALRDEIVELTENHTEMVGQINAIKRLIQ
jgi:hypothetical protein